MGGKPSRTVLVMGLDGSGKSTIVDAMQGSSATPRTVMPTVGVRQLTFTRLGIEWHVYDIGGGAISRSLWPTYVTHIDALIFVVDCGDTVRLADVRLLFRRILEHPAVHDRRLPVLVYANSGRRDAGATRGPRPSISGASAGGVGEPDPVGTELGDPERLDQALVEKLLGAASYAPRHPLMVMETDPMEGSTVDVGLNWLVANL